MTPQQLISMIKNPHQIDTNQVNALRALLHQYSYFQLGFTLVAKALYDQAPHQAPQAQAVQLAAIYATDRNHLKLLLENKLPATQQAESLDRGPMFDTSTHCIPSPVPVDEPTPKTMPPDLTDPPASAIYDNQLKKGTKQKKIEQLNIIENFIKKGNQFRRITIKEVSLGECPVDLTKQSTTLHDELLTESLAQVMLKQGKLQQAADLYKRLRLKFPDKEAYFSTILEEKIYNGYFHHNADYHHSSITHADHSTTKL